MVSNMPAGCNLLLYEDSRSNLFAPTSSGVQVLDEDMFGSSIGILFASGSSRDADVGGSLFSPSNSLHPTTTLDQRSKLPDRSSQSCKAAAEPSVSHRELMDKMVSSFAAQKQEHKVDWIPQSHPAQSHAAVQYAKSTIPPAPPPFGTEHAMTAKPQKAASVRPPIKTKMSPECDKLQGTWTAEENLIFFRALRSYGKSFNKIHDALLGRKTREQVRCYYYRIIKKINQTIACAGTKIDKFSNTESHRIIEAMLCWFDRVKTGGDADTSTSLFRNSAALKDEERFRLAALILGPECKQRAAAVDLGADPPDWKPIPSPVAARTPPAASVPPRAATLGLAEQQVAAKIVVQKPKAVRPQPSRILTSETVAQTPLRDERMPFTSPSGSGISESRDREGSCHSDGRSCASSPGVPGDSSTPERLKLRLIPKDPYMSFLISRCGFNPQLELTFKASKSIASIAAHLAHKWGARLEEEMRRAGRGVERPEFRLHNPQDLASKGWGVDDKDVTAAQIFNEHGNPKSFRLLYSVTGLWQEMANQQRAPHKGEAAAVAGNLATKSLAEGPHRIPCASSPPAEDRESVTRLCEDRVAPSAAAPPSLAHEIDLTCREELELGELTTASRGAFCRVPVSAGRMLSWSDHCCDGGLSEALLQSRDAHSFANGFASPFTGNSLDGFGSLEHECVAALLEFSLPCPSMEAPSRAPPGAPIPAFLKRSADAPDGGKAKRPCV